jgi:hypothetical protein
MEDVTTTTNNCAAGPQCLMPNAPVAKTHCCPGCGNDVRGICGESHIDAQLLYSTTCFRCVSIHGRALKGQMTIRICRKCLLQLVGVLGDQCLYRPQDVAVVKDAAEAGRGRPPADAANACGVGGRGVGGCGVGGRGVGGHRSVAAGNRSIPILNLTQVKKKTKATGTFEILAHSKILMAKMYALCYTSTGISALSCLTSYFNSSIRILNLFC